MSSLAEILIAIPIIVTISYVSIRHTKFYHNILMNANTMMLPKTVTKPKLLTQGEKVSE